MEIAVAAAMATAIALFLFFFNVPSLHAKANNLVLEDGYVVSTVLDGNKLNINPRSVLPLPGSSNLLVLDSSNSLFYTVAFPVSQESLVKQFAGKGNGYSDGESGSAQFKQPRSFAVDLKGNVYVADKSNFAIRKITNSGVTTIAGGYTHKIGREDGPAQNASFSADFELAFVPEICALLISDHGNKLVRQINLKVDDCARGSQSVLGISSVWVLGLVLSCLLGFTLGTVVRPYIMRYEGYNPHRFSVTWKHCLTNLEKQVRTLYFDIRSAAASFMLYALLRKLFSLSLCHISLMFKFNKIKSQTQFKESVSLLDSDDSSSEITKSQVFTSQLKDLMSFDGSLELSNMENTIQDKENQETANCAGSIENLIQSNLMGFAESAKETSQLVGTLVSHSGLVKRR